MPLLCLDRAVVDSTSVLVARTKVCCSEDEKAPAYGLLLSTTPDVTVEPVAVGEEEDDPVGEEGLPIML